MRDLWRRPRHPDELDLGPVEARYSAFFRAMVPLPGEEPAPQAAEASAQDVPPLIREVIATRHVLDQRRFHPVDWTFRALSTFASNYCILLVIGLAILPSWWPAAALAFIGLFACWTTWNLYDLRRMRRDAERERAVFDARLAAVLAKAARQTPDTQPGS